MENQDFTTSEQNSINGIINHLDGLEIALAHDTLHKVHLILSLTETPIDSAKVRAIWFPEILDQTKKNKRTMKLLIQNGKEYHSMGANDQMELYLWIDVWYAKLIPSACMYYKLSSETSRKVKKLTRTNLVNDFAGTPFEQKLSAFLEQYDPCKKDRKTGAYKILEVFVSN